MKDSVLRKIQVVASFALLTSVPALSSAAHQNIDFDEGKIRVSYSDLNLNSDAGVAALYRRLQKASELACETGGLYDKGSLKAARAADRCYDQVLNNMVSEINNDKLSEVHDS